MRPTLCKERQMDVRERIGEMERQKEMLTGRITRLEADLSRTLNADEWPRIDQLCRNAAHRVYNRQRKGDRSGSSAPLSPREPHLNTHDVTIPLA